VISRDVIRWWDLPYELLMMACLVAGVASLLMAVSYERRMQRHRQPGVSYRDVTLRRDGAWRRADLFTERGLAYQSKASTWGVAGAGLLVAFVVMLALLRVLR
jgi:hypothetical protein